MKCKGLVSCHGLFKKLQILPLQPQYIFFLILFVAKKRNYFIANTETRDIDTCYNYNISTFYKSINSTKRSALFRKQDL
jgi:hypothetical protein